MRPSLVGAALLAEAPDDEAIQKLVTLLESKYCIDQDGAVARQYLMGYLNTGYLNRP